MRTRSRRAVVAVALLLTASGVRAAAETVVGAVTAVSQDAVQIKPNRGEERTVTLDAKTEYVGWITHQPWQRSTAADRGSVKTGRCISVDLRDGADRVAKVVRINTDEIGSIYCPCRSAH
jgi:hypothetical protein